MIIGLYAVGPNGEFGLNNRLPWGSFPEELASFNRVLEENKGNHIIVGYKTWTTLPASVKKRFAELRYRVNVYSNRKTRELLELSKEVRVITNIDYSLKDYMAEGVALVIGGADLLSTAMDAGILDGVFVSRVHPKPSTQFAIGESFDADVCLEAQLWDENYMPPATVFVCDYGENDKASFVQEYHFFGTV